MPKISVIVPVYNVEKYLNRCIDSILGQTFTDFDLILVNDGSSDNCGIICDEYAKKDERIYVIHQKNMGQASARNTALDFVIEHSNSKWIVFIDSDDWVHTQYLELLYNSAKYYKVDVALCHFSTNQEINANKQNEYFLFNDLNILCFCPDHFFINTNETKWSLLSSPWNKIYKKHLFNSIRFPEGKIFEDEKILYRLLFGCEKIAFIPAPLYYYYKNPLGTINSNENAYKIRCRLDALIENSKYLAENGFYNTFPRYFLRTCQTFEDYLRKYKKNDNKEIELLLNNYRVTIEYLVKKYKKFIPEIKKYGYLLWIRGYEGKLAQYKKDIKNVRDEKGIFYAVLWAIKNYIKIYLQ